MRQLSRSQAGSNFGAVKLNQRNGEAIQQRHCVPAIETLTSWKYQRPSWTKLSSETCIVSPKSAVQVESDQKLHNTQRGEGKQRGTIHKAKDSVQVPGCHGAWRRRGTSSVLLGLLGVRRPVAGGAVHVRPSYPLSCVHRGEAGKLPSAGRLRGDGAGARLRLLPYLCPA